MKKLMNPHFGKSVLLITVFTFVVLGLIFGCWGTVYAAQDSLPGDLLYPVKLAQEDLQLAFTSDTQAKISLLTTFAHQRAAEATALALQGQPVPDELQTLMGQYLEELIVLTADLDEATQQEVLEGFQMRPRDRDQGMSGPQNSPVHDENNPPPRNGKGQEPGDSTAEISTITSVVDITATQTITPGMYGPGPCVDPDCTPPLADEHSPGAYLGVPPGPENYEGYGPGYDQGQGYQQPTNSSSNGNSNNTQGQGSQP